MDAARWERLQALFYEALERPEAERLPFLQVRCGDDTALLREVMAMLRADADPSPLLDGGLERIALQAVEAPAEFVPAYAIGPYRLKRLLGEGGMGVVWLAERADAGNEVAIKFLLHAGLSPARRERFAGEVRVLAKLNHPSIARMYDAGSLPDGTPWLVMEYVQGTLFSGYCRRPGRSLEERLRLFRAVCEAVRYAHGQGIIHRDLKPSNILVAEDGTPKLLDFGIAKQLQQLGEPSESTAPGPRFMSCDYAAPEWKRDGVSGVSNDVYSLGVILYETLTGRHPFQVEGLPHRPGQPQADESPERPSVVAARLLREVGTASAGGRIGKAAWAELDLLCGTAMDPDPGRRYISVEALLRDIDHYTRGEPLEARPATLRYRTSKFVRRNRVPVLAGSLSLALVVFVTVFFTVRLSRARTAAVAQAARRQRIQRFMLNLFEGDDHEVGPGQDLRVVSLIDRGVPEAQSLGAEPEVQAELYRTLGTMYMKLGKLDRADTVLQSALQAVGAKAGPDHADTILTIGLLRGEQQRPEEAERLIRDALAMLGSQGTESRPLRAKALAALGHVLIEHGRYAAAIEVLDQAVSLEATEPPSSSGTAATLNDLADAHLYLGHYDISDSLNNRALAIDLQTYGGNHPRIGEDLHDLSQTEELHGDYAKAEQHERQALRISEAWYGGEHPTTARYETALASTLIYKNRYDQAEELLRHALSTQQKVYGDMNPHVAYVLNSLAIVSLDKGDFKTAEDDGRRVAAIYRSAYGDADYRVAIALGNLASVYLKEKRYPQAEAIFKDVIQRNTRVLPADNINTAIAQIKLGRTLLAERRYREAEPYTRAGYETLLKQTNPSTSYIVGARPRPRRRLQGPPANRGGEGLQRAALDGPRGRSGKVIPGLFTDTMGAWPPPTLRPRSPSAPSRHATPLR